MNIEDFPNTTICIYLRHCRAVMVAHQNVSLTKIAEFNIEKFYIRFVSLNTRHELLTKLIILESFQRLPASSLYNQFDEKFLTTWLST